MLVIKVELWPGGNPARAEEIGRIAMANVSSLAEDSNYVFVSKDDRGNTFSGMVRNHKRSEGFWKLLTRLASGTHRGGSKIPAIYEDTAEAVAHIMKMETNPRGLK
jgi:hypothetical protein